MSLGSPRRQRDLRFGNQGQHEVCRHPAVASESCFHCWCGAGYGGVGVGGISSSAEASVGPIVTVFAGSDWNLVAWRSTQLGLERSGYRGLYVLEQDVALAAEPAEGTGPVEDARRSVEFLRTFDRDGVRAAAATEGR